MVRTQIQLTEKQAKRLKQVALEQEISVAELIRRSVTAYLEELDSPRQVDQYQKLLDLSGKFQTGIKDLASQHDAYLEEAYD